MLLQISEPGGAQKEKRSQSVHGPGLAIGIDLGTTNSLVACCRDSRLEIIPDAQGRFLEPSVVYYLSQDEVQVGHEALQHPNALHSVKRLMGANFENLSQDQEFERVLALKAGQKGKQVMLNTGEGHYVTPVQVSSEILKALKKRAENTLKQAVDQAVITVPAYFDELAREATREAAKLAGLKVLRLMSEPTAAAYAYGLDLEEGGVYAFYDLGGGTFDFTLLKRHRGVFQVLATGGDTALGGDDIDRAFLNKISEQIKSQDFSQDFFSKEIRTLKEKLSLKDRIFFKNASFSRTQLESSARPLIQKTLNICRRVCRDAKVTPSEIREIILVGGATRMPLVRHEVSSFFHKAPRIEHDPDQVVALGAALQAKALTAKADDPLLLDVTPLSLGIEMMGGIVERLIERNSPIPTHAIQTFTTQKDGQTAIAFHVVQGEREMARDCRSLAHFELKGLPPKPAGMCRVRVAFSLDVDGLLHVEACDEETGVAHHLDVRPAYGLEGEEMRSLLKEAGQKALADMKLRLLVTSQQKGYTLLHQVTQALRKDGIFLLSSGEKKRIEGQMHCLEDALQGEDRAIIEEATQNLETLTQDYAQRRCVQGRKT